MKAGGWAASPDFCFFTKQMFELAGKTMVLVGSGAIGGAVARIAEAFGMRVVRAAVPGAPTRAAARTPLAEALPPPTSCRCTARSPPRRAAWSARVPGGAEAGRDPDQHRARRPDRRGGVDRALGDGRLGGVGLDVLAAEPPPADHPLTDPRAPWAGRVVVTPHVAWGAIEARRRLAAVAAENLRVFLAGQRQNRVD